LEFWTIYTILSHFYPQRPEDQRSASGRECKEMLSSSSDRQIGGDCHINPGRRPRPATPPAQPGAQAARAGVRVFNTCPTSTVSRYSVFIKPVNTDSRPDPIGALHRTITIRHAPLRNIAHWKRWKHTKKLSFLRSHCLKSFRPPFKFS
jgi:hypothetical protein